MKARYEDPRDLSERLVLRCTLVLTEPAHLGGAAPDATSDRPLIRDADNQVYLAGTALKGVLRQGKQDALLFGSGEKNQARLIVDDAPLVNEAGTEVRDGVALEPALGIAKHKQKYDIELLPAGSCFQASFEVIIPEKDADGVRRSLATTLAKLDAGVEVGARTRRGFGRLKREGPWQVARYAGLDGLKAWLAEGVEEPPAGWGTQLTEHADLQAALGVQPRIQTSTDVEISLQLRLVGSLLIRSPVAGSGPADSTHLHARRVGQTSQPVVSGTSLAGALRARCRRIARTLLTKTQALKLIDGLFGPEEIKRGEARASRLRVAEVAVKQSQTLRHTRVRIDPWTGGAAESLLFTSEPVYGGTVSPVLRWRKPSNDPQRERAERALLLLALRDFALGDLHIGGESGTGRGRFAPLHDDGRFGTFGDLALKLTGRGLAGDFTADLTALREWNHA